MSRLCSEGCGRPVYNPRVDSRCRECHLAKKREYMRRKREEDPEAARAREREWRSRNRERINAERRAAYARKVGGVRIPMTPEERREKKRETYQENKDYYAEKNRRWMQENPERNAALSAAYAARRRAAGPDLTPEEWEALKAAYHYTCLGCGRREPEIKLEPDHIDPLVHGGPNEAGNRQPLCPTCNRGKGARHDDYRHCGATGNVPEGVLFDLDE